MNLIELFDSSLQGRETEVALEFSGGQYTFGDLDLRSNRLANRLAEDGLRQGDRLGVYLKNSVEFIDLYLTAVKLGLVFAPVNVLYRRREIEPIVADAQPKAVFTSADLEDELLAAVSGLEEPILYRIEDFCRLTGDKSATRPSPLVESGTPAAIVYTSGTTGRSKGAVLTHNNFAANAKNLIAAWEMREEDRLLLALPLFHVHGLGNGLHTWLMAGYRMRLLERFRKETIAEEFLSFRPTVFFGVPTMYERLLELPASVAREIGGFMRLFVSGSAPLPARTLERFRELYGHAILERYGMTETLMNISNPYCGERRAGTVGKPLPGVSIRLADPVSDEDVAEEGVGEVLIKGPNVFPGYWSNEVATRSAFTADGFFRSGDLATRSSDGYYTLCARKTDLIISGGFNVYPREIEEFLREEPEVAEVAVVGCPDQMRGEIPVACIVLSAGCILDEETLERRCRESLASFKVPRRFIQLEGLPRNALGKVERGRLRSLVEK